MKIHKMLFTDMVKGIFLLLAITGYIAGNIYMRNKATKKIFRGAKEISLIKQAKENFEELLNKHLQLPITIA